MPAGTVAIAANGVGQGAGISLASLVAYAALNFVFPVVRPPQGQHCDLASVCQAVVTQGASIYSSDSHHGVDDSNDDYYSTEPELEVLVDRGVVFGSHVKELIRPWWRDVVERLGLEEGLVGVFACGYLASFIPMCCGFAARRTKRSLRKFIESLFTQTPQGRYDLAVPARRVTRQPQ
jgi:hypothetical protein